jgi:hypothetical protein
MQYQIAVSNVDLATEFPQREILEALRLRLAEHCHRWSAGTSNTFTGTGEPYNGRATREKAERSRRQARWGRWAYGMLRAEHGNISEVKLQWPQTMWPRERDCVKNSKTVTPKLRFQRPAKTHQRLTKIKWTFPHRLEATARSGDIASALCIAQAKESLGALRAEVLGTGGERPKEQSPSLSPANGRF